jgi:hypothetical protein
VHTKVSVVGGAVKAEVNAKGDRCPCRVLLTAVETDLMEGAQESAYLSSVCAIGVSRSIHTLLAGLDFVFSKNFSDCCFVAREELILTIGPRSGGTVDVEMTQGGLDTATSCMC